MEQATLLKIARLRTLAARHGQPFDVVRFAGDRRFAEQTLRSVLDSADEELLVAGLAVMDALKMVAGVPTAPAAAPAQPPVPTPAVAAAAADTQRYVGRLR